MFWIQGKERCSGIEAGKASPQDRAVKSELGEEQEMAAPSQEWGRRVGGGERTRALAQHTQLGAGSLDSRLTQQVHQDGVAQQH